MVERATVPQKPGGYKIVLFQQFKALPPGKALRIELATLGLPKATLYYILRTWNKTAKHKLTYTLEGVRSSNPIAYIYIEEVEKE